MAKIGNLRGGVRKINLIRKKETHCKDTIPKIRNKYDQKRPQSQFPHSCVCERFMYVFPQSVCLFCCRKIYGPIVGLYRSLTNT